jgi:hypothetical protein
MPILCREIKKKIWSLKKAFNKYYTKNGYVTVGAGLLTIILG